MIEGQRIEALEAELLNALPPENRAAVQAQFKRIEERLTGATNDIAASRFQLKPEHGDTMPVLCSVADIRLALRDAFAAGGDAYAVEMHGDPLLETGA